MTNVQLTNSPQPHNTAPEARVAWARWLAGGLIACALVGTVAALSWNRAFPPQWGFNDKSVWDVLELLVVPLALALLAFWFNRAEKRRDERLAYQQRVNDMRSAVDRDQQQSLQNFLDTMTQLLLNENLHQLAEDAMELRIVEARTQVALAGLDGGRKGQLLQFLYGARLLDRDQKVIGLSGTNMHNTRIERAQLPRIFLQYVDLQGVQLLEANLLGADLLGSNLDGANLEGADLSGANLFAARLVNANLRRTRLQGTDLTGADLTGADLTGCFHDSTTIPPEGFVLPRSSGT